ncbi:MAG: hypothetical protein ABL933_15060 [Methyloglobulus sp.]|nr:hypothetical protein [Methyloglobulus sp.]
MLKLTKTLLVYIFLLSDITLSGCASLNDVVRAKEAGTEGITKTYPVTQEQAWDIAKTVFRWEGADAIEEHKDEGYMLTSSGMNFYSYGTVMGAWLKPLAKESTEVTVITKRRIKTEMFTTLTEGTFHKRFAQAAGIVKSGSPLPSAAPD